MGEEPATGRGGMCDLCAETPGWVTHPFTGRGFDPVWPLQTVISAIFSFSKAPCLPIQSVRRRADDAARNRYRREDRRNASEEDRVWCAVRLDAVRHRHG